MIATATLRLIRIYDLLARWWIAALFGNLTVIFFIIFSITGPDLPDGAPGVVDLQLAFSKAEFSRIVDQWGPEAVDRYTDTLWLDYVFPFVYAIFFTSAFAALTYNTERYPGRMVQALFVLPLIAALSDLTENTLHLIILRDTESFSSALILLASIAAAIKWALLTIMTVAIVALLIRRGIAVWARR